MYGAKNDVLVRWVCSERVRLKKEVTRRRWMRKQLEFSHFRFHHGNQHQYSINRCDLDPSYVGDICHMKVFNWEKTTCSCENWIWLKVIDQKVNIKTKLCGKSCIVEQDNSFLRFDNLVPAQMTSNCLKSALITILSTVSAQEGKLVLY